MQTITKHFSIEAIRSFEDILIQQESFKGEFRFDQATRILYSTDASIYQIEPIGVVFPRIDDDLPAIIRSADKIGIPVTPRGSGSSLAGQAIGPTIIIDCSRHLNRINEINPETHQALVQPGVILNTLNKAAARYNLQFGPDPASAERATIGGSIANNAAGAHSIIYGMTGDHLIDADIVLADGTTANLGEISLDRLKQDNDPNVILHQIYSTAIHIRTDYLDEIKARWPLTWRRVSGYNLNYLIPWSPSQPPLWAKSNSGISWNGDLPYPPNNKGTLNLAPLLAGSEGTLAVIQQARVNLVERPRHTILAVLAFDGIAEACDTVPQLLELAPDAIELIPQSLIRLSRSVPAYAHQLSFVTQLTPDGSEPKAILVVEFSGDDLSFIKHQATAMGSKVFIAETSEAQKQVWAVRKVGLGILQSMPGNRKPVAFIEDMAVPVERLGEFVRQMDYILQAHGTYADYYAHASAGCLHLRPLLDLKTETGIRNMRVIAEKAVELTLRLQGAVSAEHGDGLARGEWLERSYGDRLINAFRELKFAADPKGLLNPGKIIDPPPMDTNLRYGGHYHSQAWIPVFNYSSDQNLQGEAGLVSAIEQCNGAGVCRKTDGVMCPSYQASQDEFHGTRGRANILRAMISGKFPTQSIANNTVREALDLCLACKGCQSECPSGVDIAKLKHEFTQYYYSQSGHHHPWRDYLFGYFNFIGKLGYPFRGIVNDIFTTRLFRKLSTQVLGITPERSLPLFSNQSLAHVWKKNRSNETIKAAEPVLFLNDTFTEYFHVDAGFSGLKLLQRVGCDIKILPILGAGRTLISKGFLISAKNHANHVITAIRRFDPEGRMAVVGIEPSEILTLRDEYKDFFPDDSYVNQLSKRAWMIDEFLLRPGITGKIRGLVLFKDKPHKLTKVLLHGHCYQKAQAPAPDNFPTGVAATIAFLKSAGYIVELVESGCCGMAGSFGYEKEHYEFSQRVAEMALFPGIRKGIEKDPNIFIAASGVSCQTQIQEGLGCVTLHPVQLIENDLEQTRLPGSTSVSQCAA